MADTSKAPLIPSPLVAEFLKQTSVLIVDAGSSSRSILRRLMSTLGSKTSSVDLAETFEEAVQKIETHKPRIVFTDYVIGKQSALELFQSFNQFMPNRLQTVFIALAATSSPAISAAVIEADMDGLLVRPFTYNVLQDALLKALTPKLTPTDYIKMLEASRAFLATGKPDRAVRAAAGAQILDPAPSAACYLEGEAHLQLKAVDAAQECFERALTFDPVSYRCIVRLFDIYQENKAHDLAYEIGMKMLASGSFTTKRIPELIHLCILNKKFKDVVQFYDLATQLETVDEAMFKYVSAGLVICGKHLLKRGEQSDALEVFKKAEQISKGRPQLTKEIAIALISAGLENEAKSILDRLPQEVATAPEIMVAKLEQLHAHGFSAETLKQSQELVSKGVKSIRLFEISILQALGAQRPAAFIQALTLKAVEAFPEKKEFFEKLTLS